MVPNHQKDRSLTVPHPGTSAVPWVGKFTFPEVRISRSGGCECPTSHRVRPLFLYDHEQVVSLSGNQQRRRGYD